MVVLEKKNVVPEHNSPFQVSQTLVEYLNLLYQAFKNIDQGKEASLNHKFRTVDFAHEPSKSCQ